MALLFSHDRVSTPDGNEAEFLVSGIPREFDDFEYFTTFEDFLDGIEEVAYFHLRMQKDENFLSGHCDHIESVDFTCNYSPDELFGMDWG